MQEIDRDAGRSHPAEGGLETQGGMRIFIPPFFPHLVFPLMHPDLSKHSPVFPPSFPLCCLSLCSLSSLCSPGLVWYHACMHHGPANKLHRVATPLPLSLSCQVEPLKHSLSSPLHFYPSIHPSIPPSPLPVPPPPPFLACSFACSSLCAPSPHFLYLHTHQGCRSDLPPLCHSPPFIRPSPLSLPSSNTACIFETF